MKSTINRVLAWLTLMLVGIQLAAAQMPVPEAGHRVTDLAQVLNVADTESLASQLASLEARTRAQVGILIVPTLQQEPIDAFSQRVFNSWRLGRAGINDGVLMVLSVQDRKVRIHVGRGLEGTFPQSVVTRIIREHMGPAFREKQYTTGFSRAIEAISGPIAEHSQVNPVPLVVSTAETAAPVSVPQLRQPDTAKPESNLGWGILAIGAGVACVFLVVIGIQRQAKRKAQKVAEQAAVRERDEMRRRASRTSEDAYRAAEEQSRMAAARMREERAIQAKAANARSSATPARSASSYPSLRGTSSSSGRAASSSSSSRSASSKSSLSSSSSSSSRRSSSHDDDDYSRRSAASWTPSVSSYESGSGSNSSSWSGGESGGSGGSAGY